MRMKLAATWVATCEPRRENFALPAVRDELRYTYRLELIQDPALETWHGRDENLRSAQQALAQRARCNGAASRGTYTEEMETKSAGVGTPAHRREGHDD